MSKPEPNSRPRHTLIVFGAALALMPTGCAELGVRDVSVSTMTNPTPALDVSNQVLAGGRDAVTISSVVMNEPGFVAVYAGECVGDDGAASYGELLGSAALADSTYDTAVEGAVADLNEDTSVTLSRAAETNEALCAVLHRDTGASGTFEFEPTDPITYAGATNLDKAILLDDARVMTTFRALVEPSIEASDQDLDGARVMVDAVLVNGPSWVAVFDAPCDEEGTLVGSVLVPNGESAGVEVELVDAPTSTSTHCARVHEDAPRDARLTFGLIEDTDVIVTSPTAENSAAIASTFDVRVTN